MAWSELGEYLVYKNEMLPTLPEVSIVNSMQGSTRLIWLKRMSTCFFLTILITSPTYLFHQGIGFRH